MSLVANIENQSFCIECDDQLHDERAFCNFDVHDRNEFAWLKRVIILYILSNTRGLDLYCRELHDLHLFQYQNAVACYYEWSNYVKYDAKEHSISFFGRCSTVTVYLFFWWKFFIIIYIDSHFRCLLLLCFFASLLQSSSSIDFWIISRIPIHRRPTYISCIRFSNRCAESSRNVITQR